MEFLFVDIDFSGIDKLNSFDFEGVLKVGVGSEDFLWILEWDALYNIKLYPLIIIWNFQLITLFDLLILFWHFLTDNLKGEDHRVSDHLLNQLFLSFESSDFSKKLLQ